ncbi:MAG: hypothetical protein ACTHJM_14930 [Marmoricola sp.]
MTAAHRLIGATLVIACATGVAACGSSDNGRSAAASAAVSQTFLNISAPAEKPTTSQAACFGTGIVKAFGVDQTVTDGFITKDLKPVTSLSLMLSTKDAGTYADLYLKCANPAAAIKSALIAKIAPKSTAAEQQLKTCLDKNLTSSLLRKALVAGASGDTGNATLNPVFTACGQLG